MGRKESISLFIISCILLQSCSGIKKHETQYSSPIDIRVSSIQTERVNVDLSMTSMEGYSGVMGDSLYFFDGVMSYFYRISTEGEVGNRLLGFGRGPVEIPARNIEEVCVNTSDEALYAFQDLSIYRYELYDHVSYINMKYDFTRKEYDIPSGYTTWDEVIVRSHANELLVNIIGSGDRNPAIDKDYYRKASIIMTHDLRTLERKIFGSYPESYSDNQSKITHLPHIYFDVDDSDNIIVSFQGDPLMYRYNKNKKLVGSFGIQGKDMNLNYTSHGKTGEQLMRAYQKDIEKAGYYYWLEILDGMTFRSYQKSGKSAVDGLQIYDGDTLIGDVEIPKHFKPAGRIGEWYITKIFIDEDTGESYFYKFKLN